MTVPQQLMQAYVAGTGHALTLTYTREQTLVELFTHFPQNKPFKG